MFLAALYAATNTLYWKCFKRQNARDTFETSKYQTSLYKLFKNHWVITLFEMFGSVRRNLQSTVSLDYPVASQTVLDPLLSVLI